MLSLNKVFHSFPGTHPGSMAESKPEAGVKLEAPASYILCGTTSSGKSVHMSRLIEHRKELFKICPKAIHYCYTEYQPVLFGRLLREFDVQFHQGAPSVKKIKEWSHQANSEHIWIVLDDLAHQVFNNQEMAIAVTINSHHSLTSLFFLNQNLVPQGRYARDICLNCQYLFCFSNKRDKQQLSYLGRQICPGQSKFLVDAYEQCMASRPYNYILIDLYPTTPKELMLRSDIFPGEVTSVFLPS